MFCCSFQLEDLGNECAVFSVSRLCRDKALAMSPSVDRPARHRMSITGIPGTLLYLNEQLPLYILVNVVAFAVAFALTWMFGFNRKMEDQ